MTDKHAVTFRPLRTEDSMEVRSWSLAREAAMVPMARQCVQGAAEEWGLPELADDAGLIVTELAANAVKHARWASIRVSVVHLEGGRVRVSVTDRSHLLPAMEVVDAEAVGGRGLMLVAALSRDWGVVKLPWGKRVWADVESKAEEIRP